jgi:NADPH-dependent glutamate synthase beta subunit-like oxidoreductase/NAD(P)H-flavin reductase
MVITNQFGFGINFQDLYDRQGLIKIDQKFLEFLADSDLDIFNNFKQLRDLSDSLSKKEKSAILIDVSRVLEQFLVELFNIQKENQHLRSKHLDLNKIHQVRRQFVQRRIAKNYLALPFAIDGKKILQDLNIAYQNLSELETKLAQLIFDLGTKEDLKTLSNQEKAQLEQLSFYTLYALFDQDGKKFHQDGGLFKLPKKTDFDRLFAFETKEENHIKSYKSGDNLRSRDGFNLSDNGFNLNQALAESHYCIFCHNQDKDSCSTGIKDSANKSPNCNSKFKIDPLGVELKGCPLDQKISEMNLLKSEAFCLAALAIAIIDNPMIAATGHRICNDCMKSCIYQKQDPVDIPQIETAILKDVLKLPYGFEIYSLLTKWNPLNVEFNLPKENSGKKILIAGLGPAGFTLAHYLLNSGHLVVAIDGLKIEPLNPEISSIDIYGNRHQFKPIKLVSEIYENLEERLIEGFGGVAEYGITSRWDKNFLKIIRLILERNQNFRMFGGIRFGSTINDYSAFNDYGFDHLALCIGAGRPNIIEIKNNYAKGIRAASDFLMLLQSGGAYKKNLFTNLQIRMPILVIGGGLTATDTATEAQNYYLSQIEKFEQQYQKLSALIGEENIVKDLNDEEKIIAKEFLTHGLELRNTRINQGSVAMLLKKWGGVKILYRKKLIDSPAYRLNHQELAKSFEEGVEFVENITPIEAILDQYGHITKLKTFAINKQEVIFDCKSLLIAAGTSPNVSAALEDRLDFNLDGKYFAQIQDDLSSNSQSKFGNFSFFTKEFSDKKAISFFGDLHPNFAGNVVKAMASAKEGYKRINQILTKLPIVKNCDSNRLYQEFLAEINDRFLVAIEAVNILSPNAIEIVVKSKILANQTKIGQIFRLQNYCQLAPKINGQIMAMEGVAVTALAIDRQKSLISGVMIETGGSTSLIRNFKRGEAAIFMGPSGLPTEIAQNEIVMLVGGGRGNMPLAAIGKEYKKHRCKIIFFAGYRKNEYLIRQNEIEEASDVVVYAVGDELPNIKLNRKGDQQFHGNVIDAIVSYGLKIKDQTLADFNFKKIDRIFTIGNDQMMHKLSQIRHQELAGILNPNHIGITSLNAPMQCMLKGVCSSCLQKRIDPKTGSVEYFYACASQDQNLDLLDFKHLSLRCEQSSLSEKIQALSSKNQESLNIFKY